MVLVLDTVEPRFNDSPSNQNANNEFRVGPIYAQSLINTVNNRLAEFVIFQHRSNEPLRIQ